MPLSLSKLTSYLEKKGMMIYRYYIEDKDCMYLEIISSLSTCNFFVYLPSKLRFSVSDIPSSGCKINMFPIPVKKSKDSIAKSPDKEYIESMYMNDENKEKLNENLEEHYNHPIELKSSAASNLVYFRDLSRQVDRLKFSVSNISYNIVVIYQGFLCITGDDYGYFLSNYPCEDIRKLYVLLNIEILYDKISCVEEEITQIVTGIYRILDKNTSLLYENMIEMLERLCSFPLDGLSDDTLISIRDNKREKLEEYLSSLTKEMTSEKDIIKKLRNISEQRKNQGIKGIYEDIDRVGNRKKLEEALNGIEKKKEGIINNIFSEKEAVNSFSLTVDKILFDNIILVNEILKNLDGLKDLVDNMNKS